MEDDSADGRARREQQDHIVRMSAHLFMPDDGITFNKFPDNMKRAIVTHMAAAPSNWPASQTVKRFETTITNYRRLKDFQKVKRRRNVEKWGNQDGERPPPRNNELCSRSTTPTRKRHKAGGKREEHWPAKGKWNGTRSEW